MTASQSALISAIASALVASAAQYLGVTQPIEGSLETAERHLDKREAQIERREQRINMLEDALEACLGQPVPRGATPALAEKAAQETP